MSGLHSLCPITGKGLNAAEMFPSSLLSGLNFIAIAAPGVLAYNDSTESIDRRWLGIEVDGLTLRLWNQGNIPACFIHQDHETYLGPKVQEARALWRAAGLRDDKGWFKLDIRPPAYCLTPENRPNSLIIEWAGESVTLETTVGMGPNLEPTSGHSPEQIVNMGPRMIISDHPLLCHRDLAANIAHELGHAWGLRHEHQNPHFWSTGYSRQGTSSSKYAFGEGSFFCQKLADYGQTMAKIEASTYEQDFKEQQKRLVCKNQQAAQMWGFTASQWLPIEQDVITDSAKEPDWDSIMIYPSCSGSGGLENVKENAVALKGRDGKVIKFVKKPSKKDVEGLKILYGYDKRDKKGKGK